MSIERRGIARLNVDGIWVQEGEIRSVCWAFKRNRCFKASISEKRKKPLKAHISTDSELFKIIRRYHAFLKGVACLSNEEIPLDHQIGTHSSQGTTERGIEEELARVLADGCADDFCRLVDQHIPIVSHD